ncbi:MAG: class I SAM-dependent methyltransferase, partial [Sporichthyaceae bacterium]|nr:class I SAM-dependent methyltransferase [Sporichthyaceae bacterium]
MSEDAELAAAKERAWRQAAEIDDAYRSGAIDAAGWHAAWQAIIEPAYLAGGNPRAESGHSGDPVRWEFARRPVLDAIDADCDFLDVGCANGHLMESVHAWAAQDGLTVEPYGVDISAALADLARRRLPHWADRVWTANALHWNPPRRFDVVRTGIDYVPFDLRADYLAHLLSDLVASGGRLIVGVYNEERELDTVERQLRGFGYRISGRTERAHRHPGIAYKACWIDA